MKSHLRPKGRQDANRKAKKSNKTDLKIAKNLASLKPKLATGDQNTNPNAHKARTKKQPKLPKSERENRAQTKIEGANLRPKDQTEKQQISV